MALAGDQHDVAGRGFGQGWAMAVRRSRITAAISG